MRVILVSLIVSTFCVQAQDLAPQSGGLGELRFEENRGQVANHQGIVQQDVLFTLRDNGMTVFFRKHGLSYQWNVRQHSLLASGTVSEASGQSEDAVSNDEQVTHTYRVDMVWNNASESVQVNGKDPARDVSNFYLAHCPEGVRGVRSFNRIIYKGIYPGIDVEYYVNDSGNLKYDLILQAGADASALSCSYTGAAAVLANGKIRIDTPLGYVEEQSPVAWLTDAAHEKIPVRYRTTRHGFGYDIESQEQEVVIDPEILWSTYYGGTSGDEGLATAVDGNGNVFLAGNTHSLTGIAASPGSYTAKPGGSTTTKDVFLASFDSDGSMRRWATYYGGTSNEFARSMAVDPSGSIYIVGRTESTSIPFPTATSYQKDFGDIFLVKFNNDGACSWSTYYGTGNDKGQAYSVSTDALGNVYIAGSVEGPVNDINDSSIGHDREYNHADFAYNSDAFLVKFNGAGTTRLWATYYGGYGDDIGYAAAVDDANNVYLGGYTISSSDDSDGDDDVVATVNGKRENREGFLAKFSADGARQWGTYFVDAPGSLTIAKQGDVVLGGTSDRLNLATPGAFQTERGGAGNDAFVAKISANGALLWASYFGGPADDKGFSTAVDGEGNVYIAGETLSTSGIAYNGIQNTKSSNADAFVAKFKATGDTIYWATYYGGIQNDFGRSIAKDVLGVYLAGYTASTTLNKDGFQPTYGGGSADAFLTKIGVTEIATESFPAAAEKSGTTPVAITLNYVGNSTIKFWRKGISAAQDTWTSESLTSSNATFTKDLTSAVLADPIGLAYYFEITDATQAMSTSSTGITHIRYKVGENTLPGLRFGTTVSDYQIVAVPLVLDNGEVDAVFNQLGPYNKKKWRLYTYYDGDNREYKAFSKIQPGLGYWLIMREAVTIDPGKGQTVSADEEHPFEISLKPGWNLIGNPYDFPISWENVLKYNNNPTGVEDLVVFANGSLVESDLLERYRGAFVFASAATTIRIPVLRDVSEGGRKRSLQNVSSALDQPGWEVPIYVSNQQFTNELGGVGMHPLAEREGKDAFDIVAVPVLEGIGFFELQIDHPEVGAFFNKDVVPTMEEYTWDITIRRDDPMPVELRWDNTALGENEKQLYMLNPTTQQVVDMRDVASLSVGAETKNVLIIYGGQAYVERVLNAELPVLGIPYPVPSDGKVTIPLRIPDAMNGSHVSIDIVDFSGKRVFRVVNDYFSSGYHVLEWHAERSGIFLVRFQMNGQTITRKLIIR